MSLWELRQWIEQSVPAWVLLVPLGIVIGVMLAIWIANKSIRLPW